MQEPSIVLGPFPHHFRHIQKRKVKPQVGNEAITLWPCSHPL